ncbi:MAG: DUF938 domain-containing protein [Methyloligellaceae bacterium]
MALLRRGAGDTLPDQRKIAPAAARNAEAIMAVLAERLPEHGRALEIGSGTGQHVVAFAEAFPGIRWQPSDPGPISRQSIIAWTEAAKVANVAAPADIDVRRPGWHTPWPDGFDILYVANLIHIAPWEATLGLMAGAGALLKPDGLFVIYGCFKRDGVHISQSNVAFDASLRREDPSWGVRDVDEVADAAAAEGLALDEVVAMPANNLVLVLRPSRQP